MEQPSHQPPHPASHHLREPLLPLKHALPPTVALREGGRLPWRGPLAPRSSTPFVRSSRASLPFVSLQARLWTRCQLRTGTHPAVCGGTAWAQAPGSHGRAGLCTARNRGLIAALDHSRELGEDAGRPGRQGVGLRVHPQQDRGCRRLWHPRETSPLQRMGPIPRGPPGRASSDSRQQRQAFPGGPVVEDLPAGAGNRGRGQLAGCLPVRTGPRLKLGVDFGSSWIPSAQLLAGMPHVAHRAIFKEGKRGFQLAQDRPWCGGVLI